MFTRSAIDNKQKEKVISLPDRNYAINQEINLSVLLKLCKHYY